MSLKFEKDLKHKNKKKILKKYSRLKRNFKNNNYYINSTIEGLSKLAIKEKEISYIINIRVTPNNIFCNFINNVKKKTILVSSAGIYKLNVSKKKLKFLSKIIIQNFIKKLKNIQLDKTILLKIIGPIKTRKFIIKQFKNLLRKNNLIINSKALKCFNGCRPKKKRKKKQKGLRIFK
jgi:ribosomal protein S11